MEVHHHSHPEGKRLKHYLFEFFMLFLAVFCGFLAENFREHQVEHKRELQYMRSLTEDLNRDIQQIEIIQPRLRSLIGRLDSIASNFYSIKNGKPALSTIQQISKNFGFHDFIYTDRTIEQLKNAGNMRLIRNLPVADSITEYDALVRRHLVHQNMINEIILPKIWEQTSNIINKNLMIRLVMGQPNNSETDLLLKNILLTNDKNELIKYANAVRDYQYMIEFQLTYITTNEQKAWELLAFIKKGYYLE